MATSLVAGERRLRATRLAGLETIPAIVRTANEQEQLELALVENLQRADLNAVEEARAYQHLIDAFGLTQERVAARVGRSRPTIANALRILETAPVVQEAVVDGAISGGHARALAGLESHVTPGGPARDGRGALAVGAPDRGPRGGRPRRGPDSDTSDGRSSIRTSSTWRPGSAMRWGRR